MVKSSVPLLQWSRTGFAIPSKFASFAPNYHAPYSNQLVMWSADEFSQRTRFLASSAGSLDCWPQSPPKPASIACSVVLCCADSSRTGSSTCLPGSCPRYSAFDAKLQNVDPTLRSAVTGAFPPTTEQLWVMCKVAAPSRVTHLASSY